MARIIVVDDLPLAIEVVRSQLAPRGHEVQGARDWTEFVGLVAEGPAEVVVLDVHLPGVRGDALVADIHEILSPRTAVILYSATPEEELKRLTRESGALSYIHKDHPRAEIVEVVERALESRAPMSRSAEPRAPVRSREARKTLLPWNTERDEGFWLPRILIIEDMSLRRAFLRQWFGQRRFPVIQEATNGAEALERLRKLPFVELPELILTDLEMPVMDGLHFIEALEQDERLSRIGVLLYTSTVPGGRGKGSSEGRLDRYLKDAIQFDKLERHVSQKIKSLNTLRRLRQARVGLTPEI